jgi:hypothetical protein
MYPKDEFENILPFVEALTVAVSNTLMSREHAKSVWLNFLKKMGLDVPKPTHLDTSKTAMEVQAELNK